MHTMWMFAPIFSFLIMNQLSQSTYELLCNPSPIIKYYFLISDERPVVIKLPKGTNLTNGRGYHGQ